MKNVGLVIWTLFMSIGFGYLMIAYEGFSDQVYFSGLEYIIVACVITGCLGAFIGNWMTHWRTPFMVAAKYSGIIAIESSFIAGVVLFLHGIALPGSIWVILILGIAIFVLVRHTSTCSPYA